VGQWVDTQDQQPLLLVVETNSISQLLRSGSLGTSCPCAVETLSPAGKLAPPKLAGFLPNRQLLSRKMLAVFS
jgi:hypothetical protein